MRSGKADLGRLAMDNHFVRQGTSAQLAANVDFSTLRVDGPTHAAPEIKDCFGLALAVSASAVKTGVCGRLRPSEVLDPQCRFDCSCTFCQGRVRPINTVDELLSPAQQVI